MALSIKNSEVEALARELALLRGIAITDAVRDELRRGVDRAKMLTRSGNAADAMYADIMAISKRASQLPVLNEKTDDELLGYDEYGAPTR